ncbi:MAG: penicillin-binding transpeptidase domain-containing protein [Longimicrobiales bacterium]
MAETMQAPAGRRRLMLASMMVVVCIVIGRQAQIQILQSGKWQVRADEIHGDTVALEPARGMIYDRNGVPLAGTHERFQVSIAPREIKNAEHVSSVLRDVGGFSDGDVRRMLNQDRKWVVLPGRFDSRMNGAMRNVAGVYVSAVSQRFYPHGTLALELLGAVSEDGHPSGGIELEMDSVLKGTAGQATVRRDSHGRVLPGAMLRTVQPVPGRDVYLTIDAGLQEIAEAALAQSIDSTRAAGGEILLADPRTGEILAAVSRKSATRAATWRAVTETYEPGSTLKPFTVAALLNNKRATLADSVFAENGAYQVNGRRLTDTHPHGWLTLGDALRVSSNIGIAKVATRLYPEEQYTNLRNFGFGSPTGVAYPSESGGMLARPRSWSRMSNASLAIGYEIGVTPLQIAMAYGALANGGLLLEPRLIREVRARDGHVERSFAPRTVRRAASAAVAAQLRGVLLDVVADGTGTQAAVGTYDVAGKTGTARIAENGRYKVGAYTSSFAGFFPAEDPQLVFLVKLDEPQTEIYGGLVAAPVIRLALEAALAAMSSPLDRSMMATRAPELPDAGAIRLASASTFAPRSRNETVRGAAVLTLSRPAAKAVDVNGLQVPETMGLAMRDAVRALHAAGFRVSVTGKGSVQSTLPLPGSALMRGQVVHLTGAAQ